MKQFKQILSLKKDKNKLIAKQIKLNYKKDKSILT
jgi:hypothetical protein